MQHNDISRLPADVHDAVLHLLKMLVEAFPVATVEAVRIDGPSAESPPRFPRSATELLVLEALEALAPMSATPVQVATMLHRNHLEVRTVLQALAMRGTIAHPRKGYYARDWPSEDTSLGTVHGPPKKDIRPSAGFAAQIAALCAPSTNREHTKE
jgi:hypothetical protein